jgi:hypothetical protein
VDVSCTQKKNIASQKEKEKENMINEKRTNLSYQPCCRCMVRYNPRSPRPNHIVPVWVAGIPLSYIIVNDFAVKAFSP